MTLNARDLDRRRKAAATAMLHEALQSCKEQHITGRNIAVFIIDAYMHDPKALELMSNLLGRAAHDIERGK